MNNKKKNLIYISIILFITIILFFKLFTNTRLYGHDTIFHTSNIISLSKTISLKHITGLNIIQTPVDKFGYGTWLFYPKLPHLLGAYLYLITKNIYTSMNIIYFITTFLSGIVMYMLSKKIFKNNIVALLSAVIYLTFPYHVTEIYIRDAFAENFMFLALPLIFLGLSYLKDNNYKLFYILFILGYLIGMYSHLISMVFTTIFVALYLIYFKEEFMKKDKIKVLLISTIIVTFITLPFLVTLIEHKSLNLYSVYLNKNFTNRETVVYRVLEFKRLYNGYPMFDKIRPYTSKIVIVLLILSLITNLIFKKKIENKKELKFIFTINIILITMLCSKVFWKKVPEILLMIQFPWRLLTFLSLFVSLYSVSVLINIFNILSKKVLKNIIKASSIAIAIVLIIISVNKIEYYGDKQYTEKNVINNIYSLGWQFEYLPYDQLFDRVYIGKQNEEKFSSKYRFYFNNDNYDLIPEDDSVKTTITLDNFPNMKFKIENINDNTRIEIPRTYYLGYQLKDEDGNNIELYNDVHGMLGATITSDGQYNLKYTKTILERMAIVIRNITIIIIILYISRRVYEKRNNSGTNTMLQRKINYKKSNKRL